MYEETGLRVEIPDDQKYHKLKRSKYFMVGMDSVQGDKRIEIHDKVEIEKVKWMSQKEILIFRRTQVNADLWHFILSCRTFVPVVYKPKRTWVRVKAEQEGKWIMVK